MLLLRGRIPANLQTATHSVIETFWENARRAVPGGSIALHLCGIGHAQMFIRYGGGFPPAGSRMWHPLILVGDTGLASLEAGREGPQLASRSLICFASVGYGTGQQDT
jgi:hypothetical protein